LRKREKGLNFCLTSPSAQTTKRGTVYAGTHFVVPSTTSPYSNLRLNVNRDQPIGNGSYRGERNAITGQPWKLRKHGRASATSIDQPATGGGRSAVVNELSLARFPFTLTTIAP
jgi:hypothetical protein